MKNDTKYRFEMYWSFPYIYNHVILSLDSVPRSSVSDVRQMAHNWLYFVPNSMCTFL